MDLFQFIDFIVDFYLGTLEKLGTEILFSYYFKTKPKFVFIFFFPLLPLYKI